MGKNCDNGIAYEFFEKELPKVWINHFPKEIWKENNKFQIFHGKVVNQFNNKCDDLAEFLCTKIESNEVNDNLADALQLWKKISSFIIMVQVSNNYLQEDKFKKKLKLYEC